MVMPDNKDESRRTSEGSRVEGESNVGQETLASKYRAGATAAFTEEKLLPQWCAVTNSQGHGHEGAAV